VSRPEGGTDVGGAGLLPAAARGLRTASQSALLATALTVGGVLGVTGTVGLRGGEATLKEGAKVSLASTDLKLTPDALQVNLADEDRTALANQLQRTVDVLQRLEKSNNDYQKLTASLIEIVRQLSTTDPKQQLDALGAIKDAIKGIKIPEPAVTLDTDTKKALQNASDALGKIEATVKDIPPRRTIRAVNEGSTR